MTERKREREKERKREREKERKREREKERKREREYYKMWQFPILSTNKETESLKKKFFWSSTFSP
jgi:hypothetical protein